MHTRRDFIFGTAGLVLVGTAAEASVDVKQMIFQHSNAARRRYRRPVLKPHPQLARAAQEYAELLARTGQFSHTASGTTLEGRIARTGYRGTYWAENLAYRPTNRPGEVLAQRFVTGWLDSESHRFNLLHPKLTEMGVGAAVSGGRIYGVQVFGGR